VNFYGDVSPAQGFLLDKGGFTPIEAPGASGTQLLHINNRLQMVGAYGDADGTPHGLLLDKGVVTTIDAPDAINTNATDIDERGQIVGCYLEANEGQ
jgi:hypothetical protein